MRNIFVKDENEKKIYRFFLLVLNLFRPSHSLEMTARAGQPTSKIPKLTESQACPQWQCQEHKSFSTVVKSSSTIT